MKTWRYDLRCRVDTSFCDMRHMEASTHHSLWNAHYSIDIIEALNNAYSAALLNFKRMEHLASAATMTNEEVQNNHESVHLMDIKVIPFYATHWEYPMLLSIIRFWVVNYVTIGKVFGFMRPHREAGRGAICANEYEGRERSAADVFRQCLSSRLTKPK